MSEKKSNGDYEKPESHKLGDDELDEIAGGAPQIPGVCGAGQTAPSGCTQGQVPQPDGQLCHDGSIPHGTCSTGKIAHS